MSIENPNGIFCGKFDKDLRNKFRIKRLSLGLTYPTLAEFLKINPSTIRKWESGKTSTCHTRFINKITKFMNGEMDDTLTHATMQDTAIMNDLWPKIPRKVQICLERTAVLYNFCVGNPNQQDNLITGITQVLDNTAKAMLTNTPPQANKDKDAPEDGAQDNGPNEKE